MNEVWEFYSILLFFPFLVNILIVYFYSLFWYSFYIPSIRFFLLIFPFLEAIEASFLFLDHASTALDNASERMIQETIDSISAELRKNINTV